MTAGLVVRILSASAVDGPGNRAVVFLAGCNYRCLACHNPQTIAVCDGCGTCVAACPAGALSFPPLSWEAGRCRQCDRCVEACPKSSTPRARLFTPEEVLAELAPARPFLSGLTISGGEPTLQPEFTGQVASLARAAGLHTLVDSNGSAPRQVWERLACAADGVALDLKAGDESLHLRLTAAPLAPVLASLTYLASRGKLYEVRHLVIPGYTAAPEEVATLARLLAAHAPGVPLALLAFRPHGVRGELASTPPLGAQQLEHLAQLAREQGVSQVTIRGLLA